MNAASSEPAMPSRIVMMKPPGSRPGVISFAITPTIKPETIADRIPMRSSLLVSIHCKAVTNFSEQRPRRDAFMGEQPPLPVEAAAVSRELSVGSDDAMTGDDDGDRVGAVGRADRADGRGLANPPGQFAVGDGRSRWNPA